MSRDELIQLTGAIRKISNDMSQEESLRAELAGLLDREKKLTMEAKKARLKSRAPVRGKRTARRPKPKPKPADAESEKMLEEARERIAKIEDLLDSIHSLREQRRQLVERRAAFLRNLPAMTCPEMEECAAELDRLDADIAQVEDDIALVDRALKELKRAKSMMGRARTQMGKASGAADADVFLGGAVGLGLSLYKHSKMKDANREAGKAGVHIRRANKMLKQLSDPKRNIKVHRFQNISAIYTTFFDGWLADSLVADQMSAAHQKMSMTGARLSSKITELNRFRDQLEDERDHLLDLCENLEIKRDNAHITMYIQGV